MEEKIKFVKAQGHKEKRQSSSIIIEAKLSKTFHPVASDKLVLTMDNILEPGNLVVITLVFGGLINIEKNNIIRIKTELSPVNTSVIFIK